MSDMRKTFHIEKLSKKKTIIDLFSDNQSDGIAFFLGIQNEANFNSIALYVDQRMVKPRHTEKLVVGSVV